MGCGHVRGPEAGGAVQSDAAGRAARRGGEGRGASPGEGLTGGAAGGPGVEKAYGSIFVLRLWGGGCWCPWEPGTDVGADGSPCVEIGVWDAIPEVLD